MSGPKITKVWITENGNILAATQHAFGIPIGFADTPSAKEFLKAFEAGIVLDEDDAKAAQRVSRSEAGDAGRKAWAPQWTAKRKKKHLEMAFRLEKKIFRKIKEDYAAVHGRQILVSEFTGYNQYGGTDDWNLEPPLLARVTDTPEQDLFHQTDKYWIDPYWNLERLEVRDELYKVRSLWMFGTSYNIKTGETAPARYRFADEA